MQVIKFFFHTFLLTHRLMATRRLPNGSTYRVSSSETAVRCPEDMRWLRRHLDQHRLKAYVPSVSVKDPKNRRPANEVVDWCASDGYDRVFKLWSTTQNAFVPEVRFTNNARLRSFSTE